VSDPAVASLTASEETHLLQLAAEAKRRTYVPFSGFPVGAAVLTAAGGYFAGCNIENSSFGLTVCAERVAIFKAISEGERHFDAIAVVTDTSTLTPPCGACRQLIWEFCGDVPVAMANLEGMSEIFWMRDLFPKPFDVSNL